MKVQLHFPDRSFEVVDWDVLPPEGTTIFTTGEGDRDSGYIVGRQTWFLDTGNDDLRTKVVIVLDKP
jgi:hypothetical protein